jgi:hypothetical protein
MKKAPLGCAVALALFAATASAQTPTPTPAASPSPAPQSKFKSPEDGWFDLSGFLGSKYGFMPIAAPITEPSVGYGLAGGVAFIDQPVGRARPNITFVGGLGTENGTKGGLAGDLRHWLDRKVQTLTGAIYASINLDFYGIGSDPELAEHPLRYNLEPFAFLFEAKYQLGKSPFYVGAGYVYSRTNVTFNAPAGTPGLPDFTTTSHVGGITPSITLDTRDNLFTPTRGTYVEGKAGLFIDALGSDDSFQRYQLIAMQYVPLPSNLFLGVRGDVAASTDETPFYLRPFVYMRGIPAIRYQGETMAQLELELRWQFWKRLSAVAFGGGGKTWTEIGGQPRNKTVSAGGLGARYEIARAYGIHIGADFAYGPAGHAFYIQVGSAWAKP